MFEGNDWIENMWFAGNSYAEFLHPVDAELSARLILAIDKPEIQVAEIGVWKGAWVATMLENDPRSKALGIDPYPNGTHVKKVMELRLAGLGVIDRFLHVPEFESTPPRLFLM